jgi:hypothetical protein
MGPQDLETRVNKVEWTIERHQENIKELWDSSDELRKSLIGIHQTLVQIKWFALGFSCLYMADQLGLSAIFKLLG